jgi:Ca2+-binding RTX toxin-like protein
LNASFKDQVINRQEHLKDPGVSIFEDLKQKVLENASSRFMQSLYTGSGDDLVDISYDSNCLVHVTVNGKEAWKGTVDQFKRLTIDTGEGNDIVTINVHNATVMTGAGNDQVLAYRDGVIDTGAGNDEVVLPGDKYTDGKNRVNTGDGSDLVQIYSVRNDVETGGGEDAVLVNSGHNTISTGADNDYVELRDYFGANRVRTGDGEDKVPGHGMFDVIDGEGPFGPVKE